MASTDAAASATDIFDNVIFRDRYVGSLIVSPKFIEFNEKDMRVSSKWRLDAIREEVIIKTHTGSAEWEFEVNNSSEVERVVFVLPDMAELIRFGKGLAERIRDVRKPGRDQKMDAEMLRREPSRLAYGNTATGGSFSSMQSCGRLSAPERIRRESNKGAMSDDSLTSLNSSLKLAEAMGDESAANVSRESVKNETSQSSAKFSTSTRSSSTKMTTPQRFGKRLSLGESCQELNPYRLPEAAAQRNMTTPQRFGRRLALKRCQELNPHDLPEEMAQMKMATQQRFGRRQALERYQEPNPYGLPEAVAQRKMTTPHRFGRRLALERCQEPNPYGC